MKGADFEESGTNENGSSSYFDRCPLPYVAISFEGEIKQANHVFCEALGAHQDDVTDTVFINWIHADDKERFRDVLKRFFSGHSDAYFVGKIQTINGYQPYSWTCIAPSSQSIFYAVGAVVDGHSGARHLEEMEYMFRRAQDVVGVGYFSINITSSEGSTWSEQARRILGVSASTYSLSHVELLKKLVHKDDRRSVYETFIVALETASPFKKELRIRLPNNSIRHIQCYAEPVCNENGRVLWFAGTVLDISERKRIEEELRSSYRQTAAILDTTVDGIITINDAGCIHAFNKAAERLFGYNAEEVIGLNVNVLMPSPYREEHDEYIRSYVTTGKAKIIGIGREVTGLRKDGTTFPMELSVSEIQGAQHLFTGIVRDISSRREMQREILQIGEFERQRIGQELHDGLGSQLTGIGMICVSLAKQLEEISPTHANELREIANLVKEADYQARNLARGLVPVVADPTGLVSALKRLVGYTEGTGIKCTVDISGEVYIEDSTISTHLFRIAQEALVNAIKHSKASDISIRISMDGDVVLEIEDDGVGIDEITPNGEGMGLRTMKYRAGMLGAEFKVFSAPGKGTIVSCRLGSREVAAYQGEAK